MTNDNFMQYQDEINQAFPNVKDKMVIDFVNSLDVAKDHNDKSKASHGFLRRNIGLISGSSKLRQEAVNDNLISGVEACREYFQEMSAHLHRHSHAMICLNNSLKNTQNNVAEIADFVVDFKQEVDNRLAEITATTEELFSLTRATAHMEEMLSHWQAENMKHLSPMGQCFSVLDSLRWGDFGSYIYSTATESDKTRLLTTLKNKMITTQKDILKISAERDMLKSKWISPPSDTPLENTLAEVLQYQGDYSMVDPSENPLTFTATQLPLLSEDEQQKYDLLTVNMIDINRVNSRMMNEVFRTY